MKGYGDFPGGPVVKNVSNNARDAGGSLPDQGTKIPHAVEQISLHMPQPPKPTPSGALTPPLESLWATMKDPV